MKKRTLLYFSLLIFFSTKALAQVNYTANDQVTIYQDHFRPGTNMGYNPPWSDEQLANIAAGNPALGIQGIGAKAVRPLLSGEFLENYGYDSRVQTYQTYHNLGLEDLTNIVGFPVWYQRDPNYYCDDFQSELFANLYEPIWDNGENGTPVNDDNYLALYLYRTVTLYKDYVKFWEIWNEPGFDYTFSTGWLPPGAPGNWWENNPDPCDYKLRAPVFHFVRTLRVAYDVIKTIDPDAYVALAGVGYPAFLDAVLRNTDNPVDGSPTADYPLGGGAYFDVMGFHSYPHFDGSTRYWDNTIFDFVYTRHSDAAADGIPLRQSTYQDVLDKYGYDGQQYPEKEWIITEINLPRKSFGDFMGSELSQRNFITKGYINCLKNDIRQIHIYSLGEEETYDDATFEFHLMGLYEKLGGKQPYNVNMNIEGIAYKTTSDLLFGYRYDADQTAAMQMPAGVRGAALINDANEYVYVIWAATTEDLSEVASATYSFPSNFGLTNVYQKNWDYAQTQATATINANGIQLTSSPVFLTATPMTSNPPLAAFNADRAIGCQTLTAQFTNLSTGGNLTYEWTFEGGNPSSSTDANPQVVYNSIGNYNVSLKVTNPLGEHISSQDQFITISNNVQTDFDFDVSGASVTFTNASVGAIGYQWDFGDGTINDQENPIYNYPDTGTYTVVLTAYNGCGAAEYSQEVTITSGMIAPPLAGFNADQKAGCAPLMVQFTDASSSNVGSWLWSFPGGTPSSSTLQNPNVTYNQPGTYPVSLRVSNAGGSNEMLQSSYITIGSLPIINISFEVDEATATFTNNSSSANGFLWNFGDGDTSSLQNPTHVYAEDGEYEVTLSATNNCGTEMKKITVNVVTQPSAAFDLQSQQGCAPLEVVFQNESSSNASNFVWSFPGGQPSTSTEENPVITYLSAGTYPVTLIVSNGAGNSQLTKDSLIVVETVPNSNFAIRSVQQNSVALESSASGADQLLWLFGDGTSSMEANPTHDYQEDGDYTILLIASNECGADSIEQSVQIITPPSAAFSTDQQAGCAPMIVTFVDESSTNASNRFWSFPGGTPSTSTDSIVAVTYNQAGMFNASLIVSNAAGNDEAAKLDFISIQTVPDAQFAINGIAGRTVSFNNTTSNANQYFWKFGDGNTSIDSQASHTFAADGTYSITLIADNDCGQDSLEQSITISTAPSANFSSDQQKGCAPFTVAYSDLSSQNATGRQWTFPGGNPASSTEEAPIVTYESKGVYDVKLLVSNVSGLDSLERSNWVEVLDVPNAQFDLEENGPSIRLTNQSNDADSFQWSFGDGSPILTDESPSYTYTASGTYTIRLIASNECGSDTLEQTILLEIVSTSLLSNVQQLEVFPNPNAGSFTLSIESNQQQQIEAVIYNSLGQALQQQSFTIPAGAHQQLFDLSAYAKGAYWLMLRNEEGQVYQKIIYGVE